MRQVKRAARRPVVFVPALLVLLALGVGVYRTIDRLLDIRWARQVAIPRVIELAKKQEYKAALDLAREAERYIPGDPVLQQLWAEVAVDRVLDTTPPGLTSTTGIPGAGQPVESLGRSNSGPFRVPLGSTSSTFERPAT